MSAVRFITLLSAVVVVSRALPEAISEEPASQDNSLFRCDFEHPQWWNAWNLQEIPARAVTVDEDAPLKFEPHDGKALRVRVDRGGHYGISLQYRFADQLGAEPESIYFQYHLRFASDWQPERGGKLPGIAGTYGRAGWGGRPVDGTDGWSARGLFEGRVHGKTPIGFYSYHADMKGKYGENWKWQRGEFDGLENNRWYRIEQYVELNTPGKNDGVLRAWVDDRLVFEKRDVRMRDVESLKIENIWINVYYGGTWKAHQAYHLYIDDVVISRSRIGS